MRIFRIAVFIGCLFFPSMMLSQETPKLEASKAIFERILTAKVNATARADSKTYADFVASDAVFVDDYGVRETAAEHIKTIGQRPVGRSRYTVDDVNVDVHDGFVLVNYRAVEHVMFGTREVETAYRVVETYVARDGKWLITAHGEAQMAVSPRPLAVDVRTLRDYVGKYEWWPGYVDTITLVGDKLYSQGTGDSVRTLNYAATTESFYFAGEPNLVVFVRDRHGRVTNYLLHWSDGKVTSARKIG